MSRHAMILVVVLAGCGSIPAVKEDPLYWTMQGTRVLDGCTTLGVSDDPTLREKNPILGSQPSDGEIVAHVAGSMLLQHLIYVGLEKWKPGAGTWFAGGASVGSAYIIQNNFREGATCP